MRRLIAAATTSRGARSSCGCTPSITRRPAASNRIAPSPRTASEISGCWPTASGPRHSTVGWNWTNSTSRAGRPARRARASPSPVTAAGLEVEANTCPYPPVAMTTARAQTTPTLDDLAGLVDASDPHARRLAMAPAVRAGDEVEGECSVHHLHAGRHRRLVERALHLGAALVAACVHDAVVGVAALAGERRLAVGAGVEGGAEVHQVADGDRRLGDERADRLFVTEPPAGGERVGHVVLDRVVGGRARRPGRPGPRRSIRRRARPW